MRRLSCLPLVFLPLATCLEATEVRVTIFSNICEKLDVSISVNDNPPSAQTTFPAKGCGKLARLGDIVFIPKSAEPRFTFHVRGAAQGGDCATNTRCVSASRSVTYVAHTKVDLSVELTSECIGVPCPKGTTCEHGMCVGDQVCVNAPCMDAGPLPDVTVAADAPADVVIVGCIPPKRLLFAQAIETFWWPFDAINNQITEQMTKKAVPLVNGNSTSSSNMAFGCKEALTIVGSQPLGVTNASKGFGMSAYVLIPPSASTNILVKKTVSGLQGVEVFVDYKHVLQVQTCGPQACSYAEYPALQPDKWTSVEVRAPSMGNLEVTYDGVAQPMTTGFVNALAWGGGTLELGVGDNGVIDELRIYDVN